MRRVFCVMGVFMAVGLACDAQTPRAFTWAELRSRLQTANPNLIAGQIGIDESKANEITAFLRPNPNLTMGLDQLDPFSPNPYRPFTYFFPSASANYLHERAHNRALRFESAQTGT